MSRSPLAYPLTRGIDGDSGGAADLQTDVMRFMAILSLCLVAIFALVQSIPMEPDPPAEIPVAPPIERAAAEQRVVAAEARPAPKKPVEAATPAPQAKRPVPVVRHAAPPVKSVARAPQGFTLRFESDLALTRLVAAGQVGLYAITPGRAQRMTVGESRISFWDASTPSSFHEMDASTVPGPVVAALTRSGIDAASVGWGVTLPGALRSQLAALMREHSGGALVIGIDGSLALETT